MYKDESSKYDRDKGILQKMLVKDSKVFPKKKKKKTTIWL